MADKMMRLAGRDSKGLAKAIKTTQKGNIVTEPKKTARQFIGEFKEPYDEGYAGNIAVSGLEIYEKIEVSDEVVDVKLGLTGIYIAYKHKIEKYVEGDTSIPVWTYSVPAGDVLRMIALDYEDNVIWTGGRNTERVIEKINTSNGVTDWRYHDNSRANVHAADCFVDKYGNVYVTGNNNPNVANTNEIVKYNGQTGEVAWTYIHENIGETWASYGTIDTEGYLYLSTVHDLMKLDQSLANANTPPTVVWSVDRTIPQAIGTYMFIKVDTNGFIYRVENGYHWNYGEPTRDAHLVKLDQSGGEPVDVWSVVIPNPTETQITNFHSKPYLDETGNIYFNLKGKIDSSKNDFWNDIPPFTITDTRMNYLVGFNKVRGYNGDSRYVVYKTGNDLVEYFQMGVK